MGKREHDNTKPAPNPSQGSARGAARRSFSFSFKDTQTCCACAHKMYTLNGICACALAVEAGIPVVGERVKDDIPHRAILAAVHYGHQSRFTASATGLLRVEGAGMGESCARVPPAHRSAQLHNDTKTC